MGVAYQKILVEGHVVPKSHCSKLLVILQSFDIFMKTLQIFTEQRTFHSLQIPRHRQYIST